MARRFFVHLAKGEHRQAAYAAVNPQALVPTLELDDGTRLTQSLAIMEYLDTLNRELLGAIQRGGEVFVSNAVVRGQFVLRACIVNFHTTWEDVEAVPDIVGRLGAELDARMRGQALGEVG